jgi:hypothetical protein
VTSDLITLATAAPGTTVEGTIDLHNDSDEPQEAKVYLRDYLFHADGRRNMPEPGTLSRSLAPWVTMETDVVVVPPKQTRPFRYSIRVPGGADTLSGSYWAMAMVEPIAKGSAESSLGTQDAETPGVQVTQKMRYAVQIVTHIADTGDKTLELQSAELVRPDAAAASVEVVYTHTGTRAFRPTVWLEVYDAAGAQVGEFEGQSLIMYPGASATNRIGLPDDLPAGAYSALVILDGGDDALFGAQIEFAL